VNDGCRRHIEVAIHILRLALSETLQRHPLLKIIIGHVRETLPFMLNRSEQVFSRAKKPVSIKEPILKQVWITASGFVTHAPFLNALQTFGANRLLYSLNDPFSATTRGWNFIKISPSRLRI
jgi:predicted TIM-barrel fold metal-dependent hydrolase